ncbi:MAG: tyrosine-protein phosphatase [Longimicrobiaceae bacterium]
MSGLPLADIHSHLVPGVDDGARTPEEALEALFALHAQGVRRMVTTPHLDGEVTLNPELLQQRLAELDEGWEKLAALAAEHLPEMEVRRGQEVMLNVPEPDLSDPRVRMAGSRYTLVEFPRLYVPAGSTDVLYRLRLAGYVPVVAHPERYVNVTARDLALVHRWRQVGARMIVNAGSVLGGFGSEASAVCRELLERGWIDAVGSDYHARPVRTLVLREAYQRVVEWGGEEEAGLLFCDNPGRVIDGEDLIDVPPLPVPSGVLGKVRSFFAR